MAEGQEIRGKGIGPAMREYLDGVYRDANEAAWQLMLYGEAEMRGRRYVLRDGRPVLVSSDH